MKLFFDGVTLVMAHKARESEVYKRGRHGVTGTKAGRGTFGDLDLPPDRGSDLP